jgi:hypothetical protein
MTATRRPLSTQLLLAGALTTTAGALWLGCDDADCVRSLYTITEQQPTPAGSVCGDAASDPMLPVTCLPSVCAATCPQLRLTDGTPIPPSRCSQTSVTTMASGGAGGVAGAGGASPAASGMIYCEYDLDVDSCSSRQAARGE